MVIVNITMHTYFTPLIMYGVCDINTNKCLSEKWLRKNYPEISIYATHITKGVAGDVCYGIQCILRNDGRITLSDNNKLIIQQFAEMFNNFNCEATLGYYCCVDGDLDTSCMDKYIIKDGEEDYESGEDDNDEEDVGEEEECVLRIDRPPPSDWDRKFEQ